MKKGSGCYNCPVKGCTAAYRGSRCSNLRELAGVDTDPKTNADRIRAMSDEELAKWLEYEGGGACAEVLGWLEWLRQPAEEE